MTDIGDCESGGHRDETLVPRDRTGDHRSPSTTSTTAESRHRIMADEIKLKNPWLVAVWPGMGNVGDQRGLLLDGETRHAHPGRVPGPGVV